jgi:hypothetical protein
VFKIWKDTTGITLNARNTDLARLERFIKEHGELKAARAWFAYVNAEPRPYNMEPVEIAVKQKGKDGREWFVQAEDESKITRLPLAAFFAVAKGYLVAAEEPVDRYKQESFLKGYGNSFAKAA